MVSFRHAVVPSAAALQTCLLSLSPAVILQPGAWAQIWGGETSAPGRVYTDPEANTASTALPWPLAQCLVCALSVALTPHGQSFFLW